MHNQKDGKATLYISIGVATFGLILLLSSLVQAVWLPECVTDSVENPLTIIDSAPCGTYGIVTTRTKVVSGVQRDIKVQFMVHNPSGAPKALVVLFAGGNGATGIRLNGGVLEAGNNFLVRSAQLFAQGGYKAITIDRPLVQLVGSRVAEFPNGVDYDHYRISTEHRIDIEAVLAAVGTKGLPVFFAGTSRGTISAVAQNELSNGISLSSPVTSGTDNGNLFIGSPNVASLQPSFVTVPVAILEHESDGCFVSTPEDAVKLHTSFRHAGVASNYNSIDGGFDLTGQNINGTVIDECDALTHHGFQGIEAEAVGSIVHRFDNVLKRLAKE